jgi:hypothetical protein
VSKSYGRLSTSQKALPKSRKVVSKSYGRLSTSQKALPKSRTLGCNLRPTLSVSLEALPNSRTVACNLAAALSVSLETLLKFAQLSSHSAKGASMLRQGVFNFRAVDFTLGARLPKPPPVVSRPRGAVCPGSKRFCPGPYGLPTKLVTLWASSVALKRAPVTVMAVFEARLSVAEVTHGVMLHGTTPEM